MYKLHTIDVYFWLKEDAHQFLNGVRRVLPQQQIAIQDEPVAPPPHQHDMSPVVQKLENMAIAHSPYHQGQVGASQPAPGAISRSSTGTFPGPPISATPQSQEASNFAPLAYNPAAPAAPESIMHREKTPPPLDGAANPLAAAAASDQGQTYGVPFQNPGGFAAPPTQPTQPTQPTPQQHGYFPGPPVPPTAPTAPPSQFHQPPPSAGIQSPYAQHFQHSFAAPPTAPSTSSPFSQPSTATGPPPYQQAPQTAASHIPVTQQYATQPLSPGLSSSGVSSPGIYSPLQTPGTNAPPGGFATFNYAQQPPQQQLNRAHTQPLMSDYSIHQQAYRPTAEEAATYGNEKKPKPPGGKLEAHGAQVEKSVTGLLRKLEKRLG